MNLLCPLCAAPLTPVGRTFRCPRRHSFDVAREGYVNLLLPGQRRPKILGDTRDMVRARRRFLARGFFEPLSDAINELVYQHLVQHPLDGLDDGEPSDPVCIVDMGCGEGYYVGRLEHYLDGRSGDLGLCYFGMDISKEAARLAAKRYPRIRFFVASVRQRLLFPTSAVHVALNVFAPRNVVEFERVLARNGLLLVVIPTPQHLVELRSELDLLGMEADKRDRVVEQFATSWELAGERTITYPMHLDRAALYDLVCMTPTYWHATQQVWDSIEALGSAQVTASFTLLQFHNLSINQLTNQPTNQPTN